MIVWRPVLELSFATIFALACVSSVQTHRWTPVLDSCVTGEPEEGKAKMLGLRKLVTESEVPLSPTCAFTCVTSDGGITRVMKWGEVFPPTSFTSVKRRLRANQTKLRCICEHFADFETTACLFYVYAPFQRSFFVQREGIAHAKQDVKFSPMAGIHIPVKLNEPGTQAKKGFRRLNLEVNTTTCFRL